MAALLLLAVAITVLLSPSPAAAALPMFHHDAATAPLLNATPRGSIVKIAGADVYVTAAPPLPSNKIVLIAPGERGFFCALLFVSVCRRQRCTPLLTLLATPNKKKTCTATTCPSRCVFVLFVVCACVGLLPFFVARRH